MKNEKERSIMENEPKNPDRVIWRRELQAAACVSSETVRRWMKDGKLPKPDVELSHRTKGWRLSTLLAAGINLLT
jgi:predicted DNA-binding transcriptional regulator AlpA